MLQRMEDQNLSIQSPEDVVKMARAQADSLMEIVEEKKLYANISGKKHLLAEAWETIGAFNNVHAVPEYVRPFMQGEETVGYEAKVNLMKQGEVVGSGIMTCGFEEFPCQGKEGIAKHRAAMSAAQTWATSKAYRLNFAWVVVLAGYSGTPADEMNNDAQSPARGDHFCEEHQTDWFKKGKMKDYAHPQGDGEPWCDMEKKALQSNPAGPPSGSGRYTNMGEVVQRAREEYDLGVKEVFEILEITSHEQWNGTLDEAFESVERWYAEQNTSPEGK